MSSHAELCRDRMYVTRHVTDLPRPIGCTDLIVDYAGLDELPLCRQVNSLNLAIPPWAGAQPRVFICLFNQ